MFHLVFTKPRKLQKSDKRGCNSLHAYRGAVIPTSVYKGVLRACELRV